MIKKDYWDLIFKYFENDYSNSEKKIIENLLELDSEFRKNFQQAKLIWDSTENSLPNPNLENAWRIVKSRIKEKDTTQIVKKEESGIINWLYNSKFIKVAAVLIIFFTSAYLIFKSTSMKQIQFNEIVVEYTQTKEVLLPDGTYIILDSGSSFKYPQNFNNKIREVYLNGEAYFKVSPDMKNPFIIHIKDAVIKVLGTEFNVRSWDKSEKILVVVKEGKVSLKSNKNNTPNSEVILNKNQFSEMSENHYPSLPQETDVNLFLGWTNKEMYFQNVTLQEVLDQLKRWYNLEFQLPDNSVALNRVTIFLGNKKINDLLNVISIMNNLKYEQDGLKVRFYFDNQLLNNIQ